MMTTTFFFLTPMIYLSGFIFPIENMPAVIQWFTYLIPLRYFLVILRSIFLKGVGLETLWPQALALTAWGAGDPRRSRSPGRRNDRHDWTIGGRGTSARGLVYIAASSLMTRTAPCDRS